jgi:hypothetical protein
VRFGLETIGAGFDPASGSRSGWVKSLMRMENSQISQIAGSFFGSGPNGRSDRARAPTIGGIEGPDIEFIWLIWLIWHWFNDINKIGKPDRLPDRPHPPW